MIKIKYADNRQYFSLISQSISVFYVIRDKGVVASSVSLKINKKA